MNVVPIANNQSTVDSKTITDKDIALYIARLAGIPTHDALGNILSSVWMLRPCSNVETTGRLLRTADLRTILMEQMQTHIESRQLLINELSDSSVLVQWICNFCNEWENLDQYNKAPDFDISYAIQAAMHEAYMWLELHLIDFYGTEKVIEWKRRLAMALHRHYTTMQEAYKPFFIYKQTMRIVYRHTELFAPLCKLAGKLLQLNIVCFQSKVIPSSKQRSDIWEQYSTANTELYTCIADWYNQDACPLQIFHRNNSQTITINNTWQNLITSSPNPHHDNAISLWRQIDLETALAIASGAGIATHDTLGNISSFVWTRQATKTHLMKTQDIRRLLLEQIKAQLEQHKTSILEAEDASMTAQWIVNYSNEWQRHYQHKIQEEYKISQQIMAVMQETFEITSPFICDIAGETAVRDFSTMIQDTINKLHSQNTPTINHTTAPCVALFRHHATTTAFVRVACKLMIKKLLCDKPGTYSSAYQRSDSEQQFHDALVHFIESMQDCHPPLKEILTNNNKEWDLVCQSYPDV